MPSRRQLDLEQEWHGKQPRSGYKERLDQGFGQDGEDRIRGQVDLPLTREGAKQVFMLGVHIRKKGGMHKIYTNRLQRNQDTAKAVKGKTTAPIVAKSGLMAMNYGDFQGLLTHDVEDDIRSYITDKSDEKIPGGESFDHFRLRLLKAIDECLAEAKAHPTWCIALVLNGRSIKTKEAHLAAGSPTDYSIDMKVATSKHNESPDSIEKLEGNKLVKVNFRSTASLAPGVYFIRHGLTAWNGKDRAGGS